MIKLPLSSSQRVKNKKIKKIKIKEQLETTPNNKKNLLKKG